MSNKLNDSKNNIYQHNNFDLDDLIRSGGPIRKGLTNRNDTSPVKMMRSS